MIANQYEPNDPALRADPYPIYDRLRAAGRLAFAREWQMPFLTRHADCNDFLRDHRLGHGKVPSTGGERPFSDMQADWMLFNDPPDHTRLRGLAHKAFTPGMVEQLRETVQQIADGLLDLVEPAGEMDLIADLASPLTVTVIATMLGIPAEDQSQFRGWSNALARAMDVSEDQSIYERASAATLAFTAYLRDLIEERRARPRADLLSAMAAVEESGVGFTTAEVEATCALILSAGHETTFNLIGNGTLALLQNPDQWRLLRETPELIAPAIEELLRFDSPVQMTSRLILEEIRLDDHVFPPGQRIGFLLGAANRDPARFDDAHHLDIARKPNPHLAFSGGIHYCLGAPLARLQGQIAIATLVRRMPNLTLATDTPDYRNSYNLRGLESLPVTF